MSRIVQITFVYPPHEDQKNKIKSWLENFDIEFCGNYMIIYGWSLGPSCRKRGKNSQQPTA